MADKDFYQTLGVSKNATDAEIKAAYRKAALQWHPDRNKAPEASEKFKEVNEAYEVLSNPQKRQTYDQFGSAAFQQGQGFQGNPFAGGFGGQGQQGPFTYSYRTYGGNAGENPFEGAFGGGFSDPFEIFEQFFGGGFTGGPRRQRRPAYQLEISFMDAVKGAEKQIEINGKEMKIKIPAGVDEGTRVRFGNFDIVLSVRPDKTFQREGPNIYVTSEIDYPSAVLGTTLEVPTIDGPVTIKVPAGTQPDTMIRLRGRGVKLPNSSHVGDEYVRVKVKIPSRVSSEQRDLLEELRKSSKKRSGWF
ncbi:DnaJ domain-containing protein [Patescibacteria group bacterium]|nr:DnaJ domain-containing protein [Patescibacteria group bacterium]